MANFKIKFTSVSILNIIHKILIIRLSSLGDILLTTPVIRALKNKYSSSQIDFLVKQVYSDVIRFNPNINQVFSFDAKGEIIKKLKQNRYDIVIDLQNNLRSRRITSRLNSSIFRFHKLTLKKFLLVHFKMNLLKNSKTITERYAEAFPNLQLDDKGLEIFIPDNIESKLNKIDFKEIIGFCPGSKHFTKRWPIEYFINLGNKLTEQGLSIVIFGGKDDKEICFKISSQIPNSINLQNDDDILQIAKDMKKCKLIISNDSGLMHTAAAVGVPVVALFGSSVKEFGFVPYRVKNLVIENKSLSCRPCSHIGKEICPHKHFKCMKDLTPDYVYENILKFLGSL